MPAITRNTVDNSAGHCFSARPTDSAAQGSVFANGILVTAVGAHYPSHVCGIAVHDGSASAGSSIVMSEGLSVHRIGDDISCGDVSGAGSTNVFAG